MKELLLQIIKNETEDRLLGKNMIIDPESHFQLKLESRLKELGVWYKFLEKPGSTVHTADAASATGIDLHRISKNLMAKTSNGEYAALIIPGDRKVDYKEAARALGIKSLGLVPFEHADKVSGYPPGGTPSLGYETKLRVVLDEGLAEFETFFCGGGSTRMLLELRKEDVIKLNNAVIHKISKVPE
ncbi:MAG: YbaK/EbsC family protein [Candidatus Micrarchaeota archaeon]